MTDKHIYQQLVENLDDVLFVISPDWQTIHYVSPSYETVWGKTAKSLYDQPLSWLESLHSDDHKMIMAYIESKSSGDLEKISFPDYRVIHPDGSFKWIKARGFPILNEQGEIDRIAGIASDITEQKEKELAIKLSEERLNMVLEGSQQGFWDWNIETDEVNRNDRWAQMLGYFTIKEFEDNTDTWTNSIHPDDREAAWTSINSHLHGLTTYHDLEYRMLKKDGSYIWIHDHAQIVQYNDKGDAIRMSGTHTDISQRKINEKKLARSQRLIEQSLCNSGLHAVGRSLANTRQDID